MHRLSPSQQHHHQRSRTSSTNWSDDGSTQWRTIFHSTRYSWSLLSTTNEERRRMKDSFQNMTWIIQMNSNAHETHKRLCGMTAIYQQQTEPSTEQRSSDLSRWYSHLQQNNRRTSKTRQRSTSDTSRQRSICGSWEVTVSSRRSWVSRPHSRKKRNQNGPQKGWSSQRLT